MDWALPFLHSLPYGSKDVEFDSQRALVLCLELGIYTDSISYVKDKNYELIKKYQGYYI